VEDVLNNVINLHKHRFDLLEKNKRPKIGWLSIYTPGEIIHAAGLLPYRITGETRPNPVKAGGYMHRNICPYVLSCFEEALTGVHDFSSGVIIANACDARRKLYEVWKYFHKTDFVYMLDIPKSVNSHTKDYYKSQLSLLLTVLEQNYGKKITDDSLKEAISLYNETRYLLQQLYELRKQDNFPVTGGQVINIIKAGMTGLNKEFNSKLSDLLDKIHLQKPNNNSEINKPRILICGSYFDHIEIIDMLEQLGAVVVCEDISNGIKYFEGRVDIDKDPVTALADYYLDKATCARMIDSEKRFSHLLNLITEYRVDSVIYFSLKFCDNNLIDFPYQKKRLDENGIPVLFLEIERTTTNISQIKTRMQAFIERQST